MLSRKVTRITRWYGHRATYDKVLNRRRALDPRYVRWPMVTTRS